MPVAALRPCPGQGGRCRNRVTSGRCPDCSRDTERRRGTAASRGYDYRTWRRQIRDPHLRAFPRCGGRRIDAYASSASRCAQAGLLKLATDVHHIRGHQGQLDPLFSDPRNLESLCHECHSAVVNQGDFGR